MSDVFWATTLLLFGIGVAGLGIGALMFGVSYGADVVLAHWRGRRREKE